MKTRSGSNASIKNRPSESVALKNDQLLFLYIAVDRFLEHNLSLNGFSKHTLSIDRFFIGRIVMPLHSFFQYLPAEKDEVSSLAICEQAEYTEPSVSRINLP